MGWNKSCSSSSCWCISLLDYFISKTISFISHNTKMKPTGEGREKPAWQRLCWNLNSLFVPAWRDFVFCRTLHLSQQHKKSPWFLGRDCGCLGSMIEESGYSISWVQKEPLIPDLTPPTWEPIRTSSQPWEIRIKGQNGNQSASVASPGNKPIRTQHLPSWRWPIRSRDSHFLNFPRKVPYITI